ILLSGMGSAILIASHALPGRNTATGAILRASDVIEQIAGELHCAVTFTQRSATMVEITVPDRNADLTAETIRYTWSGTPGDPLTRQYNAGTIVNVAEDVQEFDLTYRLNSILEDLPPAVIEGPEILLSGHASANVGTSFPITSSDWVGQYFQPSLSADALSWKVTRISIEAQSRGQKSGATLIQLRPATANNVPETVLLEEATMLESNLTSGYIWMDFFYGNVSGLTPGQGLCLILEHVSGSQSANVRFDNAGGAGYLETADSGASWTNYGTRALNYNVYGTVTALTTPPPILRTWMRSVGITLRLATDARTRVQTAAQVLNVPEVTGL
ncbi:MAG: hypothetical protein O7D91_08330, partial [Planctomycetota bacterium]|nr:hypothetical protein [Planctomycetota bacterium]